MFQTLRTIRKSRRECFQRMTRVLIRQRLSQSQSMLRFTSQIVCLALENVIFGQHIDLFTLSALQASYPGRLGNASAIGTKVRLPCSSAMTTASAPSDLPDLIASAHSSLADFNACERASSMVASSEPSGSWISSAPSLMWK
jgi:hypothetical protein